VATSYEVQMRVRPEASARSLKDVLSQTLADSGRFVRPPEIEQLPDDDPTLLVTIWVDGADASTAQQDAADALRGAVRAAGLDHDAVTIDDSTARSSS
jgi:hypothetical protein